MEPDEFERTLAQAREKLESMRRGTSPAENEQVAGVGEAAEGRVRVTAATGGRLTKVEIDPRAMRLSPQELGAHLTAAGNGALKDLRGRLAEAAGEAGDPVDAGSLSDQVGEIQTEGMRRLGEFNEAINGVLGKVREG